MKLTYAESDKVYRHLRELKDSFGMELKRRDRAAVMIGACIIRGFDTKYQILKGLRATGLSPNLVRDVLDELTGEVVGLHSWWCDKDGVYHILATT